MKHVERKQINNKPHYDGGKIPMPDYNPNWAYDMTTPKVDPNLHNINYHPKYTEYKPSWGREDDNNFNAGNIATSAVNFAGSAIGAFTGVQSSNEILANSGQSNAYAGGIGYTYQNYADADAEQKRLNNVGNTIKTAGSGAALGSSIGTAVLPGVGTLVGGAIGAVGGALTGIVGGIFKSNKLKNRIRTANIAAANRNRFNQSGAISTALADDYYSTYGDSSNGVLHANRGKDLKQPKCN